MSSVVVPQSVPAKPASAGSSAITPPVEQSAKPPAAPSQLRGAEGQSAQDNAQNRMMSGLEVIGGALEVAGGFAFSLATGGLGAVVGGAAVLDGSMRVTHGIKDMINGERTDATISTASQLAGASRETANRIDAGAGLAAGVATGGLGVKVALQAGGTLATKAAGTALAANSLNGTYRAAEYVATGEQHPTWVSQTASAMGATSPVANGYLSLGLSASLMGGAAAARISAARAATARDSAAKTEAARSDSRKGDEAGMKPAAEAVPMAAPQGATGRAGAGQAAAGQAHRRDAKSVADLPERPPSLRKRLINEAGEIQLRNDLDGHKSLAHSIDRKVQAFYQLETGSPLWQRARQVEDSIEVRPGLPSGYSVDELNPIMQVNLPRYRRALAMSIAENPVAYSTWKSFMEGRGAPPDAVTKRPMKPSIAIYPVAPRGALASYKPSEHTINMFLPSTVGEWQNKTMTAQMSFFTHEGHHAVIGRTGVNKGRAAGTLNGEYEAERRSHLALAYAAHAAQDGLTGPRTAPPRRLDVEQRDMVGNEIRYKVMAEVALGIKDGWAKLPRDPMGHQRLAPAMWAASNKARNDLRKTGQMTLYDGAKAAEDLYKRMNKTDLTLTADQLMLTPEGAKWRELTQVVRHTADKATRAFGEVQFGNPADYLKPSPVTPDTLRKLEAALDVMEPKVRDMQQRGDYFLKLDWD